ncbi:MAG: NADH-quinone oxidoreductase subunit F [Candidatus Aminicenantes bacterium]|nr:NADH-quinone oxidoreductase subunit F [Candidatus Aminicenantes bacterium]
MPKINSASELEKLRKEVLSKRDPDKPCIAICAGMGCLSLDNGRIISAFEKEINKKLKTKVDMRATGCHGYCEKGPLVVIYPEEICYVEVLPKDVPEIVSQTVLGKKVIDRLIYTDPDTGQKASHQSEIPFYKNQMRHLMGNNTKIDPRSIDDYLAVGGYFALSKSLLEMSPEEVLEDIKKANLRGRGGGGFAAGRKWETARNAPGKEKYVIVNGHEGELGAFMDRALFTGNPHSVLEGLIIGAYAVGSHQGFVYTRHDTPQLKNNIETALAKAEEYGLLGENILGSGFDFNVEVHLDIGIFVSGESSALMKSIEGNTPEPRPKYIHTSVKGIWGKPSVLNNVETWANVPLIINKGSEWYAGTGTERSKGTKLVSLSGNIINTGVAEVPFGTTIREIVYSIGGGIPKGKKLKAVHFGGPMGGSIPESLLDTPLDFDELAKLGAPIGAGSMLVLDEDASMVDVARYFLDFLSSESCGKCVPCREGIRQMLKILNNISDGKGTKGDIKLLEEISEVTGAASLCALGKTAADPLRSTLRYFRDEYETNIDKVKSPAEKRE